MIFSLKTMPQNKMCNFVTSMIILHPERKCILNNMFQKEIFGDYVKYSLHLVLQT
jgi:hypothetical protein